MTRSTRRVSLWDLFAFHVPLDARLHVCASVCQYVLWGGGSPGIEWVNLATFEK